MKSILHRAKAIIRDSKNPDSPISRFIRFCIVGLLGTIVNLLVLYILVHLTSLDTVAAAAIAIEASILFNFSLNNFYTFKIYDTDIRQAGHSIIKKLLRYNIGTAGGAMINLLIFALLFKIAHLEYLLAEVISIGGSVSFNYYVSIKHVWIEHDIYLEAISRIAKRREKT